MFFPLIGRNGFNEPELSLVDANLPLLTNYLTNNAVVENPEENPMLERPPEPQQQVMEMAAIPNENPPEQPSNEPELPNTFEAQTIDSNIERGYQGLYDEEDNK